MEKIKKYAPMTIRILIAVLFLISAFAKLYPSPYLAITTFEKKQLLDLGFDSCFAPYFSRLLIALELALGIAILQPHYLKKIVIPVTVLLLSVFTIHLSLIDIPNCGCFGELIPMSPNQAIVKNVISIILLIYLFRNVSDHRSGKNKLSNLILIYLASTLFLFMLTPMKPCIKFNPIKSQAEKPLSPFSEFIEIEGYSPFNIDEGEKILCFFAPGCDHCMEAAMELNQLSIKNSDFPQVHIIFMDEEKEKIGDFFVATGIKASYQIMDIGKFWELLAFDGNNNRQTPAIVYLKNGNIEEFYYSDENEFDSIGLEILLSE